ncbi:MAG: flagellar biosynthesis anti-sigma factor FlgM [Sphingomonas oligoaromativorans]
MINGIGLSTGGSLAGIGGKTATQRGEGAQRVTPTQTSSIEDRAAVSTTSAQMVAEGAPVDLDRVASLRAAIKSGQYRPDARAIAGSMIQSDMGAGL